MWDSEASFIFSAVITRPSLDMSFHGGSFPVANIFSSLVVGKVVAHKKKCCYTSSCPDLRKAEDHGPTVIQPALSDCKKALLIEGYSTLMVLSRCSMTDITSKLFCLQVLKRCTKHSTSHLPYSCERVMTALICQLLPRLPKNSDICSL